MWTSRKSPKNTQRGEAPTIYLLFSPEQVGDTTELAGKARVTDLGILAPNSSFLGARPEQTSPTPGKPASASVSLGKAGQPFKVTGRRCGHAISY